MQTFQHEGVARASYVQFYWYRQEAGDGNYLHPVPAQALIGATGEASALAGIRGRGPLRTKVGWLLHVQ